MTVDSRPITSCRVRIRTGRRLSRALVLPACEFLAQPGTVGIGFSVLSGDLSPAVALQVFGRRAPENGGAALGLDLLAGVEASQEIFVEHDLTSFHRDRTCGSLIHSQGARVGSGSPRQRRPSPAQRTRSRSQRNSRFLRRTPRALSCTSRLREETSRPIPETSRLVAVNSRPIFRDWRSSRKTSRFISVNSRLGAETSRLISVTSRPIF